MALPTALDIDVIVDEFGTVLDELTSKSALVERDIERLRHALYRQGGVDRRRAARIFQANRLMQAGHDHWGEFFLEALVEFFLEYQDGELVLPANAEGTLLTWLGDGASIDHSNERRLILRILLRTSNIPTLLERRVLDAVKENLLHQSERWLGVRKRSAGVVDVLDMQLIRRLVHGAGGQYPRRISPAVVTFLLNLEQHAKQFIDPEGWRQLLIDGVVRHLTMDPLKGSGMGLGLDVELGVRIEALFDEGHSPEKTACLRNEILSAMQLGLDRCEDVTSRPSAGLMD